MMNETTVATPPLISAGGSWDETLRNIVAGGFTRYFDTQATKSLNRSQPRPLLQGDDGMIYEAGKPVALPVSVGGPQIPKWAIWVAAGLVIFLAVK